MRRTLSDLCEILAKYGMQATVRGDASRTVTRVSTLEDASENEVSFLSNPKYLKQLEDTRAGAVVARPDVEAPDGVTLICTEDPYAAITALIVAIHGYREHPTPCAAGGPNIAASARIGENARIHPGATIADDVAIGKDAVIYPGCYIGPRCRIGDNVLLYPNVTIYDECVLGDRVAIHSGTVIGNDGLGYAPVNGKWVKIPQIGIVEIGHDVEIGSNCSIDRATLGRTKIGSGVKMSNLIAIGHGTQVGEDCLIVAQVGLAGSVNVGNHVTLAGQVGVVGHITIGDNATIGAKAGVVNSVPPGETYLGAPAIPISDMRRQVAHIAKLPKLAKAVKKLERQVADIEEKLD